MRARPTGLDAAADRVWRPSVWFNPWHFQSGEQMWAGLATTIIDGITERMTPWEREWFFLNLNAARVNPVAVRRGVYDVLWRRLVLPLAVLALAAVALATFTTVSWVAGGFSLAALAAIASQVLAVLWAPCRRLYPALVRSPAYARLAAERDNASPVSAYIADPGHDQKVGYTHLAYVDLRAVIDLVATERRPLVVFVDDLDRCRPAVVAQTLEALNLFMAGPFRNCIFVMAVEPAVLAAHVACTYDKLLEALGETSEPVGANSLGWRFLEKMVQLPVNVPRPRPEAAAVYLARLLPLPDGEASEPAAEPAAQVASITTGPPRASRSAGMIAESPVERMAAEDRARRETGSLGDDARPYEFDIDARPAGSAAAQIEAFALRLGSDPSFREACCRAVDLLPTTNPRQLKRLLALIQLYALIANRLGYLEHGDRSRLRRDLDQIAVLAALNVRWPQLADWLLGPRPDDPAGPLVIERLAAALHDDAK